MFRFPYVLLNCVSKPSVLLRTGIREQLGIWQQALFVEFLYSRVALAVNGFVTISVRAANVERENVSQQLLFPTMSNYAINLISVGIM